MKCSKCGHRSNSLAAMAKHYRKKHPGAMKRKAKTGNPCKTVNPGPRSGGRFCPHCGGFLG